MAHEVGQTQQIRNLLSNKDFNQMSLQGQIEYVGKRFPNFEGLSAGQYQLLRNKVFTSPIEDVSGDVAGMLSAPKLAKDLVTEGLPLAKGAVQSMAGSKTVREGAERAVDIGKTIGGKFFPKTRAQYGAIREAREVAKAAAKGGPQAIKDRPGLTMPKFGGSAKEELQSFGKMARRGRNRAMEPEGKPSVEAIEGSAEEALGKPAKATEKPAAGPEESGDYYGKLTESIRQAAQAKDSKVAQFLKSKGINKQKWGSLSAEEKNKLIKQAAPSHRAYSSEKGQFRFDQIAKLLD